MDRIGLILFGNVPQKILANEASFMSSVMPTSNEKLDLYVQSSAYSTEAQQMSICKHASHYKYCIIALFTMIPNWLADKRKDQQEFLWGNQFTLYLGQQLNDNLCFPKLFPDISHTCNHTNTIISSHLRFEQIPKGDVFLFAQAMEAAGARTSNHLPF